MLTKIQKAHLIVYSQALSPCGQYIAVGTNFGYLCVFDLKNVHSCADNRPVNEFNLNTSLQAAHGYVGGSGQGCYSLATAREGDLLFGGTGGCILAWSWTHLIQSVRSSLCSPTGVMYLPPVASGSLDKPEVNGLYFDATNCRLYSASGDAAIHCWDMAQGFVHYGSLRGHEDSVLCVGQAGDQELVSSSEDGTVRVWDIRQPTTSNSAQLLRPTTEPQLARPHLGSWISVARCQGPPAGDWDWLVCGGGPRLAIWHRRALKPTSILEPEPGDLPHSWTPQHVAFIEDRVVAGGNRNKIYQWLSSGSVHATVPASPDHVMHLEAVPRIDDGGIGLVAAGLGKRIDLFGNLGYKVANLVI